MLALARSSFSSLASLVPKSPRTFSLWQKRYPKLFKSNSVCVVRDCRAQIEFVIAYRVRRGLQLLILYSKLGEEQALWRCFQLVKRYFVRYSKSVAISMSASVIKFNWAEERIKDDEMTSHFNDIDLCHRLKKTFAMNVPLCDEKMPPKSNPEAFVKFLLSDTCWKPFVNLNNLTIWKKQTTETQSSTLCCYKIYGYFEDVKALTFLQAYLDLETRKTWDQHVLRLEVVESEPETNSDLIYWISKWPRLFSNRDYVYKRRYLVDHQKQLISVVSKAATHPKFPPDKSNWRVKDYWSYLIVKPYKTFQDKGLEFSLTYYDDPGSNLPGSMLIWATVHGMPNYFNRLYEETKKIEKTGGKLVDFKKDSCPPPLVEANPFEGYETEEDEIVEDPQISKTPESPNLEEEKRSKPERLIYDNAPFPLPPPSDPDNPPILPRKVTQDELIRSWKKIKSKVKESVDKVSERCEELVDFRDPKTGDPKASSTKAQKDEPVSPSSGEPHSGQAPEAPSVKPNSMTWDPYLGAYLVKSYGLVDTSKMGREGPESSLVLVFSDHLVIDAIVGLKRAIWKLLFDRIWR